MKCNFTDYTKSEIEHMQGVCQNWGKLKILDTREGQVISVEKHDSSELLEFRHNGWTDGSEGFYNNFFS